MEMIYIIRQLFNKSLNNHAKKLDWKTVRNYVELIRFIYSGSENSSVQWQLKNACYVEYVKVIQALKPVFPFPLLNKSENDTPAHKVISTVDKKDT